ncbi:hypothetical protein L798_02693 [Zootermopsis nevadensis]|uniref:Uncharacterized protein n=1 Tax=Zootermopsis nevadensis TaxID=136037 RepID=A0A067RD08_ZOONE|nr:hypothetical protein L798_02693 [Zootermopsis nevadensis]
MTVTDSELWSSGLLVYALLLAAGAGVVFLIVILCKILRRYPWAKTFQSWIKKTRWKDKPRVQETTPKVQETTPKVQKTKPKVQKTRPKNAKKRSKIISNRSSINGSTAFRAPPKRSKSRTRTTISIQPDSSISSVSSNTYNLRERNRIHKKCKCVMCYGY